MTSRRFLAPFASLRLCVMIFETGIWTDLRLSSVLGNDPAA